MVQTREMVPPDGGWGWVIVVSMGINNVIYIPIMQCFGLIFGGKFEQMGFSATDGSVIITMNAACSMMSGLINGPLLKIFGYRKISVVSAILMFVGLICTAYSNSFISLLISYGFITSLGMGMGMSSYPLAFNSYFKKLRNKAMGISWTITGLGPVFMPQLISLLLYLYGVAGSVLILAAITSHCLACALLLHPVKWHMKPKEIDEEKAEENTATIEDKKETEDKLIHKEIIDDVNSNIVKKAESAMSLAYDSELQAVYGYDTPLAGSVLSLYSGPRPRRMSATSFKSIPERHLKTKWASANSLGMSPYGSLTEIPEDNKVETEPITKEEKTVVPVLSTQNNIYNDLSAMKTEKKKSLYKRIMKAIVYFFDLTLLKDPVYVNIMIGMSFAIFAELNFSLLTPFILVDFSLNNWEIATFLSVLSIADLLLRFCAPFIGDYFKKSPRKMYSFSLVLLIITRYSLLLFSDYKALLGVAVGLGIAKGVRTVYMSLVLPSYVPIDRLANASGIQMMVNGILILFGGPMLGLIRDVTGSYTSCIYIINTVTLTTILMWSIEGLYFKFKKSKMDPELEVS